MFTSVAVIRILLQGGADAKLLENMDKVTRVLELLSGNEFKNRDHLPVVPKSGLCCRVALMLKDEPKLLKNMDRVMHEF